MQTSIEDAYEKAGEYMRDYVCDYRNLGGKRVRTHKIEAVDCFLSLVEEKGVQEVFSTFYVRPGYLTDEEYYDLITTSCNENELSALRNKEFA